MKCREIIRIIEETYPISYAMSWDNPGLLVGRQEKEVRKIMTAVDLDDQALRQAVEEQADLIVTHHPLLFSAIKKVTDEDFIGKRLVTLLQHDICCYAVHTNYDVVRMGQLAAKQLQLKEVRPLEVTATEPEEMGIGVIGTVEHPIDAASFANTVKESFDLESVRLFGASAHHISKVAVCPGAGSSVLDRAIALGADVLVTGDIGHHSGIDAWAQGMAVIDAGHYGLEYVFMEDMKSYLELRMQAETQKSGTKQEQITVMAAKRISPFTTVI